MAIGAREVIEMYNEHLPPDALRRSIWKDADVSIANAFLRWCNEKNVCDVKLWMWIRFKYMKSGHPRFNALASDALLSSYTRLVAKKARTEAVTTRGKGAEVRALVDCQPAHEAVRRRYASSGKVDLCVLQPSLSGGYHPYSDTCVLCERAMECAQRVNEKHGFDVVALRLGKLDTLPAHIRKVVG